MAAITGSAADPELGLSRLYAKCLSYLNDAELISALMSLSYTRNIHKSRADLC